jgi:DNA-binding response OmpR family regulator
MAAGAKVLVVEHKTPLGMRMAFLLTYVGCDVQVVHTGKSAMELALEKPFDAIILDLDLPDFNGFEFCRRLKEAPVSSTTPVVFVSIRPNEQKIQHALKIGAADYITTPFEATDFIFRIVSQARAKASPVMALSKKETAGPYAMGRC